MSISILQANYLAAIIIRFITWTACVERNLTSLVKEMHSLQWFLWKLSDCSCSDVQTVGVRTAVCTDTEGDVPCSRVKILLTCRHEDTRSCCELGRCELGSTALAILSKDWNPGVRIRCSALQFTWKDGIHLKGGLSH